MPEIRNLTGQKFTRLISLYLVRINNNIYWRCLCDCGKFKTVRGGNLTSGAIKSCGCYAKKYTPEQLKQRRREQNKKFKQSPKGKAVELKRRQSEKYKAYQKAYNAKYQKPYRQTARAKIKFTEYRNRPEVKAREAIRQRRRKEARRGIVSTFTKKDYDDTFKRFGARCFKCGAGQDLTIDHHYPAKQGFALSRRNAAVLCLSCNSSKNDLWPFEFYAMPELERLESRYGVGNGLRGF